MVAVAFLSSAIPVEDTSLIGKAAPKIETISGKDVVNDANSAQKTKVVSFWNPKNPASRISNRNLSKIYGKDNEEVEFISICTDSDSVLMEQVMRQDGMVIDRSYAYSEISPRVFKDYAVDQNPMAFVISSQGKITEIL